MIWSPYSSSCQCGGVGGADGWVWGWAAVVLLAVSGSATFACCRHPWRLLVRVFVRSLYVQGTAWGSDSLLRQLLCLSGWLVGWLAGWLVGWLVGWLPIDTWRRIHSEATADTDFIITNRTTSTANGTALPASTKLLRLLWPLHMSSCWPCKCVRARHLQGTISLSSMLAPRDF